MSIFSEIEKITKETFLLIFLDILFLISPGAIVIFYFYRDIFISLDTLKLVFLDIAIISPIVSINTFLSYGLFYKVDEDKKTGDELLFIAVTNSLLITSVVSYTSLAITHVFKSSLNDFLLYFAIFEMVFFLIFLLINLKVNKVKKIKNTIK
ncbi:MAG: hypothetical protein AAB394_02375 [Patescibacteria group bacterium]